MPGGARQSLDVGLLDEQRAEVEALQTKKKPERGNIFTLDVEGVVDWIHRLGATPEVIKSFRHNNVDGAALRRLTDEDLERVSVCAGCPSLPPLRHARARFSAQTKEFAS